MTNTVAVAVLGAAYVALFVLERAVPLRRSKARLLSRLLVNVAISAAAFAAAVALVQPAAAAMLGITEQAGFGLMRLAGLSGALEFAVTFLLLDLSFYYWHVANHRVPFLWRFHNVHHIDPDLDVSTAFRFHFVEVGFSAAFRDVAQPQSRFDKGDGINFSIASASILAKVHRDRIMTEFDVSYPGYGFASHKGYATREHQQAIRDLGPSPVLTRCSRDYRMSAASRRNIRKAAKAARRKRTIAHLPKRTRTALGKEGAKAAKRKHP